MQLKVLLPILLLAMSLGSDARLGAQTSFMTEPRLLNVMQVSGGYLGVAVNDMDADRVARLKLADERGVEVTNLEEGGPADTAGIKAGDVLLTYNGENILGARQFVRLVRETPPARKVRLTLWRNGKEQTTTITTGSPHPLLQTRSIDDGGFSVNVPSFGNMPDVRSFRMPDVPSIIMVWNNSSIGIECEPIETQLAQFFGVKQGVLVRSVGKGTAAEKAGFKAGDVLTSVGNHPVRNPEEFRRALKGYTKPVGIALMRDHRELTLNLSPLPDHED